MPSITGYTAERTQDIEDAIIVTAAIVGGHLILTQHDGGTIDAGDVRGGEQIPHSKVTAVASNSGSTNSTTFVNLATPLAVSGFVKYRSDTKLICQAHTGIFNNATAGFYEAAVLIGSAYTVMFNGYGVSHAKSGVREINGLAAGTYTISLRYRTGLDGVGATLDGMDGARNELMVTETF